MKTQNIERIIGFVALGTCLYLPCSADDTGTPIDRWLTKALDKNPSTTGMRQATFKATKMWDAEMNRAYRHVLSQSNATQRASLIRSQKAWLTFRDAESKANMQILYRRQGTMWLLAGDSHSMEIVKSRALQLKNYERDAGDK